MDRRQAEKRILEIFQEWSEREKEIQYQALKEFREGILWDPAHKLLALLNLIQFLILIYLLLK